jgi:hypothetical protein
MADRHEAHVGQGLHHRLAFEGHGIARLEPAIGDEAQQPLLYLVGKLAADDTPGLRRHRLGC